MMTKKEEFRNLQSWENGYRAGLRDLKEFYDNSLKTHARCVKKRKEIQKKKLGQMNAEPK